jgi:mycothiol S-conjugate amidase
MESPYTEIFERWAAEAEEDGKRRPVEITTRIPCGDSFEVRAAALRAHATQVDPDGAWFACPIEVQQTAWPTEDYHLARSLVNSELPEDDLFAGIRSGAGNTQLNAASLNAAGRVSR